MSDMDKQSQSQIRRIFKFKTYTSFCIFSSLYMRLSIH